MRIKLILHPLRGKPRTGEDRERNEVEEEAVVMVKIMMMMRRRW